MAHLVGPPPAILASHLIITSSPTSSTSNQLPANLTEKAVEDDPGTWLPATRTGDLNGVPGSWLSLGPVLTTVAIW